MTFAAPRGCGRKLAFALPLISAIIAVPRAAHAAVPGDPADAGPYAAPGFTRPFYVGAYLGDAATQTGRIQQGIDGFGRLTGKRPALVKVFQSFDADYSARGWAGQMLRQVQSAGSTPYLALDLKWRGAPRQGLLAAINAGRADAQITAMARGLAGAGTVLVEPGWEMNGRWGYAWQPGVNGDAAAPAAYRQAFRHIVEIFRREGARNVKWVFAPNVGNPLTNAGTGPGHWNWYGNYYPGNDVVDYLGPHGYNGPSVWGGRWQAFADVFDGGDADHMLSDLEHRFPGKPIIIGEMGSQEAAGQDKGRWIEQAFAAMRRHPAVIGAIWFNTNKEADWRIESSSASVQAFRAVMSDRNVRTSFNG
jgi:endoglucanase